MFFVGLKVDKSVMGIFSISILNIKETNENVEM
jgi:hypothetical protein